MISSLMELKEKEEKHRLMYLTVFHIVQSTSRDISYKDALDEYLSLVQIIPHCVLTFHL